MKQITAESFSKFSIRDKIAMIFAGFSAEKEVKSFMLKLIDQRLLDD
jgi:hypothetical protein